jgi:hypothetical protein
MQRKVLQIMDELAEITRIGLGVTFVGSRLESVWNGKVRGSKAYLEAQLLAIFIRASTRAGLRAIHPYSQKHLDCMRTSHSPVRKPRPSVLA